MENADFGARLRHIRNNILGMTLEDLGTELDLGKSQLSNVEGGRSRLGAEALLKLIEKYKDRFDVRYLFGQLDNPDHADLQKSQGPATTDNVLRLLKEQGGQLAEISSMVSHKVRSTSDLTNEAQHVEADEILRNLVRKIVNLKRGIWGKLEGYIDGMNDAFSSSGADETPDHAEAGRKSG